MPKIPEEIRCFADPEKPCPLRVATYAIETAWADSDEKPITVREREAVLDEAMASLSRADRPRLLAAIDPSGPTEVIRPGSCKTGPMRRVPFVGKEACNAAAIHIVAPHPMPYKGTETRGVAPEMNGASPETAVVETEVTLPLPGEPEVA